MTEQKMPLTREQLGQHVVDVSMQWSRENYDRPGAVLAWDKMPEDVRELHMRMGEALFALGMTFSPVPSAATRTAEQARPETAHSLDEFGFLNPQPAESKSSVKLTPENVAAEIEGMRLIPSSGERPWVEVLAGPHPVEVSRVAGALLTITTSTTQRYMIAYRLYENGLLAGSPVTETTKQPQVFWPGETVPAGMDVMGESGAVYRWKDDKELIFGPVVEVPNPSPAEWRAAVDRARSGNTAPATEFSELAAAKARLDAVLAQHCRDDNGNCVVCWDVDGNWPMAWPCETARILRSGVTSETEKRP